jgi:site-specific DNA recombinase
MTIQPRELAVNLARVSSKRQEDEGYSLPAQKRLLNNYADGKNFKVLKTFEIAETASKAQQRKIFQDAMKFIEDNSVKNLIVEKVDRHVRNLHDAVETHDWLMADKERRVHFVKDGLIMHQNSRSQEWLNWGIRVVIAKNYIDNLREEAMKGWTEKLAQGWLPASPPPGYKTISHEGKRIHVPDPATKGTIEDLFKLFLDPSHSVATITQEMYLRGIRTRAGRPYAKSKAHKMLTNPFYIGINHFDGKDYPGKQETFISKELFNRVQKKMHGRRPAVYNKHNPIFKNLIHCDNCGGVVTWQLQKGRYYGRCQRLKPECKSAKTIREDRVEEQVIGMLKELISPAPSIIEWVTKELQKRTATGAETREQTIKALDAQLSRLSRMDNELYDDKLAGDITRDMYDTKHAHFAAQKAELETKRDALVEGAQSDLEQRLALLNLSQKAAEIYQTRTVEQKRLIIIKLFKSITYNNGSISVTYTNFVKVIANKTLKTKEILGR